MDLGSRSYHNASVVAGNNWLAALAALASYTALGELGYMRPGLDADGDCVPTELSGSYTALLLGVALLMYIWLVASVATRTPRDRWIRTVILYAVSTAAAGTLLARAHTHIRVQLSPRCERFLWPCVGCGDERWYELMAPYIVPALVAGLVAPLIGVVARRVLRADTVCSPARLC
jgi:hypothetical protein